MRWWLGLFLVGCAAQSPSVVVVVTATPSLLPPVARKAPERVTLRVEKLPPRQGPARAQVPPPVISPPATSSYPLAPRAVVVPTSNPVNARVYESSWHTPLRVDPTSQNAQIMQQIEQQRAWTQAQNRALMAQPSVAHQNDQVLRQMEQQRARIQAQNQALSAGGYPRAPGLPGPGRSASPSVKQLEEQYYQAQADFLNTKYCSHGPPRWTAQSARGDLSSIAPPNPVLMSQLNPYNPVIQKYQQAQAARQELRRANGSNYP